MDDYPLMVYALTEDAPTLRSLLAALHARSYPVSLGVGIAGDATETELDAPTWDAVFLRWNEPERHEVVLLERDILGEDEEATRAIDAALRQVANYNDPAGQLIVTDHLRRTQAVYGLQILPALLADDDHAAWAALDTLLTTLAEQTNGLIYAASEGFFDAEGELLLGEEDLITEDAAPPKGLFAAE